MKIYRALPEDAQMLSEIAWKSKAHWGYPQEWMEAWRDELSINPETIERNVVFMAQEEEKTLGWYSLTRRLPICALENLWVVPDYIGKGIGRILFMHAVNLAEHMGALRLQVTSDPNARGFYERMGAVVIGEELTVLNRRLPVLSLDLPHDYGDRSHPANKHIELVWQPVGQGRLALTARPGRRSFEAYRLQGCTRLATLLSEREDAAQIGKRAQHHELAWSWLPLESGRAPEPDQTPRLRAGILDLSTRLAAGDWLVVHCAAGIHRTGMVGYALLRLNGFSQEQALDILRTIRPQSAPLTRLGIRKAHIDWVEHVFATEIGIIST